MAPPMLLLLLLSILLFLVAPSCSENPLLIGSTEGLRNYTRVSEFRVVNRRVLGTCPDPNPYLDISVSPDSRLPDEGQVTVTVSGVLLPVKSDWVAMITPANADSMDTEIFTQSLNGTDNNNGESSLSKKSKKRGPTKGNFFEKEDQTITLATNEYGIPNENSKDRITFVSTIGVLARTHLPITYKSFPEIPEVFKKKVIDTLSECYNFEGINGINVDFVTHNMKECWRGHKNSLYVKYIKNRDPLVVKESPAPFNVPIEDWRAFVDYCNTMDFKALSERNQKNRKKMTAPATLGRKPIAVLRHEMAVEKNLGSDCEVARSDAYLKCHTKKDGSLLCSSVASNIKKIEHADPSSRLLSINDSLTQALGKDKGGRMRGLSGCLSRTLLKKAAPLVEKNKSLQAKKNTMTNEVMELKENYKHVTQVIAELKETIVANKQGGNTLSTRKPFFPLTERDNIVGKQCVLYGWARRLIAHGLIQSADPNLVVHGKAAGSGNFKIALTEVVDPTCQLWLSDGFHDNIGEVGVGGFVVWPEHSVEVMNG